MFHGHLDYFQKTFLGGRPNTKPEDHGILNTHDRWFILFYYVWGPAWIEIAFGWGPGHVWLHTTLEDLWPHRVILKVSWDGLWTLSFGLSQFHGHGSWLVCEVALKTIDFVLFPFEGARFEEDSDWEGINHIFTLQCSCNPKRVVA